MLLASRHACRARVCRWRMRHRTVGGPGSCGQHMRPPGVPRPPGPGWCRPRCSQRGGMRCVAGDAPDTPGTAPRSLARCAVSQQAGGCRQHTRRPARARHGGAPLLWHRRRALRLAAQLRAAGAIGQRSGTPEHATPGPAAPIRTPGAPAARSRPSPAECCRPATRRPSRRAKGARRGPRMWLAVGSLRASSSVQSGWMRRSMKASAHASSSPGRHGMAGSGSFDAFGIAMVRRPGTYLRGVSDGEGALGAPPCMPFVRRPQPVVGGARVVHADTTFRAPPDGRCRSPSLADDQREARQAAQGEIRPPHQWLVGQREPRRPLQ